MAPIHHHFKIVTLQKIFFGNNTLLTKNVLLLYVMNQNVQLHKYNFLVLVSLTFSMCVSVCVCVNVDSPVVFARKSSISL